MVGFRSFAPLLVLAAAACGDRSAPDRQMSETSDGNRQPASWSQAESKLLEGGASPRDLLAARAFIAPFSQTDQANCFGTAELNGATMAGPAEPAQSSRLTRVAIAVDGSGSMAGRIGSRTKLERAHEASLSFIDSLPASVPASLVVFGQQGNNRPDGKAKSCSAIDVAAPMSTDRAKIRAAVDGVRAVGWTPLAEGLRGAQRQLASASVAGEQVVYVVSDGVETCGGDPVAVARDINTGNTRAIVNIIGLGLPTGEAATLRAVASAGGGRFVNVVDDGAFERAMAGFREEMRLAQNRVNAGLAKADNAIATGATATEAIQCTGGIIAREMQAALASYDTRTQRGAALPPRYQVVALLKERHDKLAARRDEYVKLLETRRDAANDSVERTRQAAQ